MQNISILTVDDDLDLLYIEERCLVKAGYSVLCAQNIPRALQLLKNHTPDLLLLDINLPTGSGMNIHERLRSMASLRDTPVIYITGQRSVAVTTRAREMGAFAVIYKPVSLDVLLTNVREALETRIHSKPILQPLHAT